MRTFLGGCGFIGSNLCRASVSRGDAVRVLDDLSTGAAVSLPAGTRLIQGDVADLAAVRRALCGVDGCFHLAAVASVERSKRHFVGKNLRSASGRSAPAKSGIPAATRRQRGRPLGLPSLQMSRVVSP